MNKNIADKSNSNLSFPEVFTFRVATPYCPDAISALKTADSCKFAFFQFNGFSTNIKEAIIISMSLNSVRKFLQNTPSSIREDIRKRAQGISGELKQEVDWNQLSVKMYRAHLFTISITEEEVIIDFYEPRNSQSNVELSEHKKNPLENADPLIRLYLTISMFNSFYNLCEKMDINHDKIKN